MLLTIAGPSGRDRTVAGVSWCVVLIVVSVLFEVGGLFLVALHLWRVQRRELGMPAWWLDLGRLLKVTKQAEAESVSIEAADELDTAGEASAARGAGESVDSRVDALQTKLAALEQEVQTRAQQQDRMQAVIEEAQAELQRHLDESEERQRERLRESTTTQWNRAVLCRRPAGRHRQRRLLTGPGWASAP